MTKREFNDKNARRITLIRKKYAEGLTDAETAELASVTVEVSDEMQRRFPRDTSVLDEQADRIDALRRERTARKDGG